MTALTRTWKPLYAKVTGIFLLIAAVTTGATLYLDIEAVDERVVAMAEEKTKAFFAAHRDKLTAPWESGVRSTLQGLAEALLDEQFIVVELYDRAARPLAEAKQASAEDIESAVHLLRHDFPIDANSFYKRHFIANSVYVQVFVPIMADDARRVGFFEGVYKVDLAVVSEFRTRVFWSLALAVLSAIAGTALVYRTILARRRRPTAPR